MTKLLAIESSGTVCSVAWGESGKVVEVLEEHRIHSHAEKLPLFCDTLLTKYGRPDAVCLNTGPGSYTGLRIGASLAKGLAFGYEVPVIGMSGIWALGLHYFRTGTNADWVVPCVDARRMEVYQAVYSPDIDEATPITPLIVNSESWQDYPGKVHLIGDGAAKLHPLFEEREAIIVRKDILPSAGYLLPPSFIKFENREFLDLAYFEPFYLKEFAGNPIRKNA